ncbi:hypothetical protein [Kibdelosporangium philippinense]|uniref:hypothetical protein n=1 Tax=Kibdelosporangium philippinense TaxID=211113 RepID=UPI0036136FF2
MSAVPEDRVHRSGTSCRPLLKAMSTVAARMVDTVARNGGHDVLQRWTRSHGTVDTRFRNGGHGGG